MVKITDIYATSVDNNKNAPTTRDFFASVFRQFFNQNRLFNGLGYFFARFISNSAQATKLFLAGAAVVL